MVPVLDAMLLLRLPSANKSLILPAGDSAAQRCPSAVGPLCGWAALFQ